jgi:hypothetical protein
MFALPLILAGALLAQNSTPATASLRAHRVEPAPTIDGRLDEAAWKTAEAAGNFKQIEPVEGVPATERTEVRVLYDNTALYVGVRLYDSEPGKIVRRLSRRDDDPDADKFTFYVDGLHDRLTGAAFEVSAAGAQRDAIISNDTNRDGSWDAVWDAAVSIDSEGWSAELRIPLSQLRFLKEEHQTWGFNVERFIHRKNERDWFLMVPKKENGLASRMADLTDIDGVQPRGVLEIVPYSVARTERIRPQVGGNPFNDGSRYFGSAGFDLKYALKPNIVLNATVNPDFGQVEIDPAVVNLGAFETFFPEKRPFFIEGQQIFSNFGNLGANNGFGFNRSEPDLIHTRRIGRNPQGFASGDFVDVPSGTTILGAAKVTGKTESNWSFGVLDAVTSREEARISTTAGTRSTAEVEPSTNYFAGRVLKEFSGGRAGLGTLVTSVNRTLNDASLRDLLPKRESVAGFDGYLFLSSKRNWVVNGRMAFSDVAGSAKSIERLQLEPQRYFQRPDTPEVQFDPTRTSMRGWTGHVNLNRNQGSWNINTAIWAVSPGFDSSDLGFHYDGDRWGSHVAFTKRQIDPDRFTRYRDITVARFYVWDYNNRRIGDGMMTFGSLVFPNYWDMGGNMGLFKTVQDDRLTRGGPPALSLSNAFGNLWLNSDFRKKIVLHFNAGRNWWEGNGGGGDGSFSMEWKPSPQVSMSSGPSYSHTINDAQWLMTEDDASAVATYGKRYVFGRLQQKQFSMDTRVNVLFTPKMSVQVYMQPLVVAGDVVETKSLARPKSYEFDPYTKPVADNPDFNFKSLRVNAIFRWEWRLGSTLYLAWTQSRVDAFSHPGDFQFGRDVGRVFTAPADNVFLIKISRWFGK